MSNKATLMEGTAPPVSRLADAGSRDERASGVASPRFPKLVPKGTLCRAALASLVLCSSCAREPRVHSAPAAPASSPASVSGGVGCSDEERRRPARSVQRGLATYYHDSLSGNRTASGAPYDPDELSAAHRTLPFGTRLRVSRTDVVLEPVCVTVNDRGPFAGKRRIVDVSRRAAESLDIIEAGVVPVAVEVL